MCPEGTFPQVGNDFCYKCPADTPIRLPQYDVNNPLACQRSVTAQCSRIKLPTLETVRRFVGFGEDQKRARNDLIWTSQQKGLRDFVADMLNDAYEATGASVDVDAVDREMTEFYREAVKEPLAALSHVYTMRTDVLTPYAGACPWVYENVMNKNKKGSIPDSASEVEKAMIAIWDAMVDGKEPIFARQGSYYYSVKVDKKIKYCYGKCK